MQVTSSPTISSRGIRNSEQRVLYFRRFLIVAFCGFLLSKPPVLADEIGSELSEGHLPESFSSTGSPDVNDSGEVATSQVSGKEDSEYWGWVQKVELLASAANNTVGLIAAILGISALGFAHLWGVKRGQEKILVAIAASSVGSASEIVEKYTLSGHRASLTRRIKIKQAEKEVIERKLGSATAEGSTEEVRRLTAELAVKDSEIASLRSEIRNLTKSFFAARKALSEAIVHFNEVSRKIRAASDLSFLSTRSINGRAGDHVISGSNEIESDDDLIRIIAASALEDLDSVRDLSKKVSAEILVSVLAIAVGLKKYHYAIAVCRVIQFDYTKVNEVNGPSYCLAAISELDAFIGIERYQEAAQIGQTLEPMLRIRSISDNNKHVLCQRISDVNRRIGDQRNQLRWQQIAQNFKLSERSVEIRDKLDAETRVLSA